MTSAGGEVGDGASPSDVALRLVEREPRRLSELEAIIGAVGWNARTELGYLSRPEPRPPGVPQETWSDEVSWLSVMLHTDLHHGDPYGASDADLASYRLHLSRPLDAAVEALRARHGAPLPLRDDGREVLRFDRFYLEPASGSFRWHAEPPPFAKVTPSRAQLARLTDALLTVFREGPSEALLRAHLGPPRDEVGWRKTEPWTWHGISSSFDLELDQPIPAAPFAKALGIASPRASSRGVHRTGTYLVHGDGRWPEQGRHRITIAVSREGLRLAPDLLPGRALYDADAFAIEHIEWRPRSL